MLDRAPGGTGRAISKTSGHEPRTHRDMFALLARRGLRPARLADPLGRMAIRARLTP